MKEKGLLAVLQICPDGWPVCRICTKKGRIILVFHHLSTEGDPLVVGYPI